MKFRAEHLLGLAVLLLGGAGCFQDFEQFRPGEGGAGGQGTGGEGGTDPCANVDCNDDNPCTEDICDPDGNCLHPAASVFTVQQVSNDCKELTCEGTMLVTVPDTDDLPLDDGNPCTAEACDGENPVHPALPEGTTCNGTGVCDDSGLCSDCLDETMCGTDTECADFSCVDNTCEVVFDVGLVISGGADGDCMAVQCVDGNPDPVNAPLDTDIEDDGEECTEDTCDNGTPQHDPTNIGGACDDGLFCTATDTCNASGVCVGAGDPCAGRGACADTCNELANNCFDPVGSACDDGLFCNGADSCDGSGNCSQHAGNPCVGGTQCADTCNETLDNCFDLSGASCGSSVDNACTDPDTCDGSGTCNANHALLGTPCADANFCNGAETCNGSGACLSPGNPCMGATPNCCETGEFCTDFLTDEANCGACGTACAAGATDCDGGPCECVAGACECDGDEDCPGSETCNASNLCE